MARTGIASIRARLVMHRLHHTGVTPLRALLIGDQDHLLSPRPGGSIAERTADRLWLTTRRGVDLDVLTDLTPVLRAVQGVFGTWRLWRYDVVLVALGAEAEPIRRPRALHDVRDLLASVLGDAAGATDVVVLADAGTAATDRSAVNRLHDAVIAVRSDRVRYRAVPADGDPVQQGRAWAGAAAEEGALSLRRTERAAAARTAAALRAVPDDEPSRQRALDALDVAGRSGPRLDDLVELARTAFGTESAEINFIDRDRLWRAAVAGADRGDAPRATSFCNLTIQRSEPTIVGDARFDPLLSRSPFVYGPNAVRFYAAHPIESAEGYRIGSFCIYDSAPRDVSGLAIDVLRDLALLAQVEIAGVDAAPVGSVLT